MVKKIHGQKIVLFTLLVTLFLGCSLPRKEVQSLVSDINEKSLQDHVNSLAAIGPRPEWEKEPTKKTRDYIMSKLKEYGYSPREELFRVEKDTEDHFNVLAELKGYEKPEIVIEVGAHFDTVPSSPGADDNSSGVAGVLEIARVLSGSKLKKTIRFCFFAMEEQRYLGSIAHVENILANKSEKFEAIIVLEMIGYFTTAPDSQKTPARVPLLFWPPTTGDFISIVGNVKSLDLADDFERAVNRYIPDLKSFNVSRFTELFKDASRSDHSSYWKKGLKGIMLTDTANFRNPNYHKQTDTPDTVNYTFMKQVTIASAATLVELAGIYK